jgi:hypothetical protein
MDFNSAVAAEHSHRIDLSMQLGRHNMQLYTFGRRDLLLTTLLLTLPHFAALDVPGFHYIVRYNEQAFLFQKYI